MYIADNWNERIRVINTSGIISTIAGNGTSGFSGDGGQATAAALNSPTGIAFDKSGNIYIADAQNHRIRKVSTSGIISTIAGSSYGFSGDGWPATVAQLNQPEALAFDTTGNLYIVDNLNQRIRKIDVSGIMSTVAGTGGYGYNGDGNATSAELNQPQGVAVASYASAYWIICRL